MDWINIGINLAELIIIVIAGLFLNSHLRSYFEEKGRNLATKEDIKDITSKIESVRTEYAKQLHVYQLTFGKEFEVLREVWQKLIDLRRATQGLRPLMDYFDPNEPEEERKRNRLKMFFDSYHAFADAVEKNQPFYPRDIYASLREISLITYDEADEYRVRDSEKRPLDDKYWENALTNQEAILKAVDDVCELIRNRVAGIAV